LDAGVNFLGLKFQSEARFAGVGVVDGDLAHGLVEAAVNVADVHVLDAENDEGVGRVDFVGGGGGEGQG